jgi:pyrroline-5-carboxylate reductase
MTIAIIGVGAMGEAVLAGLLDAGMSASEIVVTENRQERIEELTSTYGVRCESLIDTVIGASIVFIVVKPQDVAGVLEEMAPVVATDTLVISLAAGLTTAFLESKLPDGIAVARVMPNTPSLLKQGMSVMSAGSSCTQEHLDRAEKLLSAIGRVAIVPESQQDSVTAISGSGPAYIFYIAEAMYDAGLSLGVEPEVTMELVLQTIFGAATMLRGTGVLPEVLRQRVSSPNGTTVAAINTLDAHGVREAFEAAMLAAKTRSAELGA